MDSDIESNPGPETKTKNPIFFFYAAIEMPIIAHGKLSVLRTYNTAHKYDVICISESYLDSAAPLDDNSLSLNG